MTLKTRYATTGQRQPFLPGLDDDDTETFSFTPPPRSWQQTGVKIGPWFIPIERWHERPPT